MTSIVVAIVSFRLFVAFEMGLDHLLPALVILH